MRAFQIVFLVVVGFSIEATAGPRSGGGSGGSGGGRLASVSGGIAKAGHATAGVTRPSTGPHRDGTRTDAHGWAGACSYEQYHRRVYDGMCERRCPAGSLYRPAEGGCVRTSVALVLAPAAGLEAEGQAAPSAPNGTAHVSGYVGAQKVFESDGAIAIELAITDRWLRLDGGLTRFYESQPSGDTLTMTMPSLELGVRINHDDATRVYLEAGVIATITKHDPVMDSSITGAIGGVVAEHSLSTRSTLVGAAKVMRFPDNVRAASLRAGIRYRHVQASFSILDFNVGPALYGPELGVGF